MHENFAEIVLVYLMYMCPIIDIARKFGCCAQWKRRHQKIKPRQVVMMMTPILPCPATRLQTTMIVPKRPPGATDGFPQETEGGPL